MPRISPKHQVTLPVETLAAAGLKAGDEVSIEADGPDTIVVKRARRDVDAALGIFDGLYEPGNTDYLAGLADTVIEVDDEAATVALPGSVGPFHSGSVRCPPLVLEKLDVAS